MLRLEITSNDVDQDAGVMIADAASRLAARDAPIASEVRSFCDRLKGYTFESYQRVIKDRDQTPLPHGYDNARVFDDYDGTMLGCFYLLGSDTSDIRAGLGFHVSRSRATAGALISMCLCRPLEEITAWRSTRPLRQSRTGTLDLTVDIDIRPRKLLVTGEPLPDHIVKFMAPQARKHG